MAAEWNKWLEGTGSIRQAQGMLLLGCILLAVYFLRQRKNAAFWSYAAASFFVVLFPLSAIVLMAFYTPFYGWEDLFLIVPVIPAAAAGAVYLTDFLSERSVPGPDRGPDHAGNASDSQGRTVVPGFTKERQKRLTAFLAVVIFLLFSANFHSLEINPAHTVNGIPVRTNEALAALEEITDQDRIVIAAPSEVLLYVRMYNGQWETLYGRDLWDSKAAGYVASAYDSEYICYELLEQDGLSMEGKETLEALIPESGADCVIVPVYWLDRLEGVLGYEFVILSDYYAGILKEELVIHE